MALKVDSSISGMLELFSVKDSELVHILYFDHPRVCLVLYNDLHMNLGCK